MIGMSVKVVKGCAVIKNPLILKPLCDPIVKNPFSQSRSVAVTVETSETLRRRIFFVLSFFVLLKRAEP